MPGITVRSVRQYYEQNTRLFSFFSSANRVHSIHRALWLPGASGLEQALKASNELVLKEIRDLIADSPPGPFSIVDLGCGIGGTLFFLLKQIPQPVLATGITISPIQAGLAQAQSEKDTDHFKLGFIIADFQAAPLPAKAFDLAYSIEAFAHAPQPDGYLAEFARMLRPGGRLVLIDDFLSETVHPITQRQQRWLEAYQQGWRLPGLCTPDRVVEEAGKVGFRLLKQSGLTLWLKLLTFPAWAADLTIKIGNALPVRHAIWGSVLGSLTLQHCLKEGLVEYKMMVFEKQV